MTEPSQAPRAGWYPDPHVRDQMRFWDGSVWTDKTFAARQDNTAVGYRFALLAHAVRAGLILSLVGGIGEVVLYVWGLWRRLISPDTALVGWWWAATLVSAVAVRIGSTYDSSDGLDGFKSEVRIWLVSSVVGIVSAVLALVMVRRLTRGGLVNSAPGGRSGLAGPSSGTPRPL